MPLPFVKLNQINSLAFLIFNKTDPKPALHNYPFHIQPIFMIVNHTHVFRNISLNSSANESGATLYGTS